MAPASRPQYFDNYITHHHPRFLAPSSVVVAYYIYKNNNMNTNVQERDRVNLAIDNNGFIAVTAEFVEEMRDCVPPQTMKGGLYSIIQVGEISKHDNKGVALYETFIMMNEEALRLDVADARMEVGQWYFTGLKPAVK
jgi:hypothetical protein